MMRRIISLLAAVFLLGSVARTVSAHEIPDSNRTDCTIEVLVRYDGKNISGGTLTAIRTGDIAQDDGNYFFRRVCDGAPLQDIQSASAVSEMQAFVDRNEKTYRFEKQTVPIRDGKGTFLNLRAGLYLIVQESPASGYHALNSFLVSVPYWENGSYQYHVSASVKPEVEREVLPTVPQAPTGTLPQTGQLNWPIPFLTVGGLLLLALGWALQFAQKRENDEK